VQETDAEGVLRELMAGYQAGDLEAFEELYSRTQVLRYHLAYAADRSQASDRAQALDRIPERHRDPLVFHHLLGLSFREIGGVVGASEGGARIRAARGMAALRRVLGAA
jgi:hypothetical protein